MEQLARLRLAQALADPGLRQRVFLAFLLVLCATHDGVLDGVRVWASLFAVTGLVLPALCDRPVYWFILTFTLGLNLLLYYESAGNHYWLSVYTSLFFTLDAYRRGQGTPLAINIPRGFLIVAFGFASLHKILSTYFTSGRLLGSYILGGHSLYLPLSAAFKDHEAAVQLYSDAHAEVSASALFDSAAQPLTLPFDGFPEFCLILTAGIVVFEVVMFAALAVGRVFHHPAMPGLLLFFVWGTFLFRGEYTFFSLICFLFFLAKPRMPTLWKALILASMVIFLALDAGEAGTVL